MVGQPGALHRMIAEPLVQSASSAAYSVTVWLVLQLEALNTSDAPDCTVIFVSPLTRLTVTVVGLTGA